MKQMASTDTKALAGLAAFLRREGAARVAEHRDGTITLAGGKGAQMALPSATLARAASDGLVTRKGDRIALAAGAGAAARAGLVEPSRDRPGFDPSESPLAQLAARKGRDGRAFLEQCEVEAGERLRADYTRGQIMPRLGANWISAVATGRRSGMAGGMGELTDAALAARQRVDAALAGVGPELGGVLIDVCCFHKGMETVEFERGWPVRSAKVVLKTALAALARHYWPDRRAAGRTGRVLHWGADGYRPDLSAAMPDR
ncbi:MAG: DUF6456 domain-containing protein [Rhizobiaceae bacterium]|nr:DUF6456 domain-containing protein [Rhizobiaceae bacterium]MCV0405518.1 DUF6456 domain-containing protein [Rhizobiaceae bacterium]